MNHNADKDFFEYLIKNILLYYNIIDGDFIKSECPDFINNDIGLEITRADETLKFDGFIKKYPKVKTGNIEKFNKHFEENGGRFFKKTDVIVKLLNLVDTFYYHEDYVYIIPSYKNDFTFINEKISNKIDKLNSIYDGNIKTYYLGVFTTVYATEEMIQEELAILNEMNKNKSKQFDKIIIIFLDKICIFNLTCNKYKIIDDVNEEINKLSRKTKNELDNINNH